MKKPSLQKSFYYAIRGIFLMIKSERNFQIELGGFLLNLFLIYILKLTRVDAAMILLSCSGVLAAEIFNTCIEKICDFIEPSIHPKIAWIKDAAAGAVLLVTIFAVLIGGIIYYPYIFS